MFSFVFIFWKHHNSNESKEEYECMEEKPKRSRAAVDCDAGKNTIHNSKRHGVGNQKEDQCRIQRVFDFQTKGERHLLEMWVIFRDPQTNFRALDKFILGLVEDKDILVFQDHLATLLNGRKQEIHVRNPFIQLFLLTDEVEYYARKYDPLDVTTLKTNTAFQPERKRSGKLSVSQVPVLERRNPCNTER